MNEKEKSLREEFSSQYQAFVDNVQSTMKNSISQLSNVVVQKIVGIQDETINQFRQIKDSIYALENRIDAIELENKNIRKEIRYETESRQIALNEFRQQSSQVSQKMLVTSIEPITDKLASQIEELKISFRQNQSNTFNDIERVSGSLNTLERTYKGIIDTVEVALKSVQRVASEGSAIAIQESNKARDMTLQSQVQLENIKLELREIRDKQNEENSSIKDLQYILSTWKVEVESAVGELQEQINSHGDAVNIKLQDVVNLLRTTIAHVRYIQKNSELQAFSSPVINNNNSKNSNYSIQRERNSASLGDGGLLSAPPLVLNHHSQLSIKNNDISSSSTMVSKEHDFDSDLYQDKSNLAFKPSNGPFYNHSALFSDYLGDITNNNNKISLNAELLNLLNNNNSSSNTRSHIPHGSNVIHQNATAAAISSNPNLTKYSPPIRGGGVQNVMPPTDNVYNESQSHNKSSLGSNHPIPPTPTAVGTTGKVMRGGIRSLYEGNQPQSQIASHKPSINSNHLPSSVVFEGDNLTQQTDRKAYVYPHKNNRDTQFNLNNNNVNHNEIFGASLVVNDSHNYLFNH